MANPYDPLLPSYVGRNHSYENLAVWIFVNYAFQFVQYRLFNAGISFFGNICAIQDEVIHPLSFPNLSQDLHVPGVTLPNMGWLIRTNSAFKTPAINNSDAAGFYKKPFGSGDAVEYVELFHLERSCLNFISSICIDKAIRILGIFQNLSVYYIGRESRTYR